MASNLSVNTFYNLNGVENLEFSYSAGTFTIHGTQGRDLSGSNPAYIYMPSNTAGRRVKVRITANQSFQDDAGTSDIVNNLFGWTTGVAITTDVPFYIYAVLNDAEDSVQFMLSRSLNATSSPTSGNIGYPSSAVADSQDDFWSFDDITATSWDSNSCMCIGSIRMQMSAADDWTVQTLSNDDGIGRYQGSKNFSMPTGQMGANSGSVMIPNGGTEPTWATKATNYCVDFFSRKISYVGQYITDNGADGAGAVAVKVATPYINLNPIGNGQILGSGCAMYTTPAINSMTGYIALPGATVGVNFFRIGRGDGTGVNNFLQYSDFTNGTRLLYWGFDYVARNNYNT